MYCHLKISQGRANDLAKFSTINQCSNFCLSVTYVLYKHHVIVICIHFFLQFDVNQKHQGRTLLHIAADYGQAEVIEYLVESKQADVNVRRLFLQAKIGTS